MVVGVYPRIILQNNTSLARKIGFQDGCFLTAEVGDVSEETITVGTQTISVSNLPQCEHSRVKFPPNYFGEGTRPFSDTLNGDMIVHGSEHDSYHLYSNLTNTPPAINRPPPPP